MAKDNNNQKGEMIVQHFHESIATKDPFTDITETVRKIVKKGGVKDGVAIVYSTHTTALVRIMENETLLMEDMVHFLERIVPSTVLYKHDDIAKRNVPPDERINGFSHLRALFFNHSETIPIKDGVPQLGKWQSVFAIECDPYRTREFMVVLMGK